MPDAPGRDRSQVPTEIILNLTSRQRRPMLVLLIPAAVFPLWLGWNMFTTMAVGFALLGVYRAWTMKVVLSGDLLRSSDLFFRRRIARKDILRVGEERVGAVRRTFVTTEKRMYYLPVPIDGRLAHNPNFDEHYAIVEDWWKGRRPRGPRQPSVT